MALRHIVVGAFVVLLVSTTGIPPAAGEADPRQRPQPADTEGHHIRDMSSNLCVAAREGTGERPVIQTTCDYSADTTWLDQYWRLLPVDPDNDLWRVQNPTSHLCVVARGNEESAAIATVCGSGWQYADGIWRVEYVDKWDAYRYQNYKSGLCLTARGDDEIQAVATTCDTQMANQHWW